MRKEKKRKIKEDRRGLSKVDRNKKMDRIEEERKGKRKTGPGEEPLYFVCIT